MKNDEVQVEIGIDAVLVIEGGSKRYAVMLSVPCSCPKDCGNVIQHALPLTAAQHMMDTLGHALAFIEKTGATNVPKY